jgi:hypothetical protein
MKIVLSSGVVAYGLRHGFLRSNGSTFFPGPRSPEANDTLPHHVAFTRLGFQWSDT